LSLTSIRLTYPGILIPLRGRRPHRYNRGDRRPPRWGDRVSSAGGLHPKLRIQFSLRISDAREGQFAFVMQRGFHGRMKTLRPRRYQRQKRGIELANRAAGEPPKLQMHNQATFGDSDRLGMNRYQFPRLYHRICFNSGCSLGQLPI
jgi:hypothetical protein